MNETIIKEILKESKQHGDRVIIKIDGKRTWATIIKTLLGKWKLKLDNGKLISYDSKLIIATKD